MPWVCYESDFSFVIYNRNNLTDEGKSYVDWLKKRGISFGVWDGVGVLSHKGNTAYYHIAIDGTSNFFETPVAVLNYSVSKPSMDNASQEEVYYVCGFYSMTMSMNKTTLTLNLDSTAEGFDDIAFELLGERVCFSNQST